ncbi:mevalonate kinase [Nocardia brasiliensis]|uniref:mevalonate kinase n=1 Tax=Nocardia brasiliensis TaxID=37326 RepID=UPI002453D754|nr:mevalonate kinase [Nocardia brasiliensis]
MRSIDAEPSTAVGSGRASGKAILIGEHAVVYGVPAIAIPVPSLTLAAVARLTSSLRRSTVDCPVEIHIDCAAGISTAGSATVPRREDGVAVAIATASTLWGVQRGRITIEISGNLPPARGVGFSAACAAAAVRAYAASTGNHLDAKTLFDLVQCAEQRTHGRASGVDAATVTAAGPIIFRNGTARLLVTNLDAVVILADTGEPGLTRVAVRTVESVLNRQPGNTRLLLNTSRRLVDSALRALAAADADSLGARMTEFHRLLAEFGVSTIAVDRLVDAALGAGALGAKLTGGGLGGCVIALATPSTVPAVIEALAEQGAVRTWTIPIPGRPQ